MAKLKVNKLILNDVRCFKGIKEFNIRPLTFLVGENSTGKSTVLGCFQAMTRYITENVLLSNGESPIDFNSDPFQMGSFENIARKPGPKNKEFELGFELTLEKNNASKFQLLVTFGDQVNSANPITKKVRFIFDDGEIIFRAAKIIKDNEKSEIKIDKRNSKKIFTILLIEDQYDSLFSMYVISSYTDYYKYFHLRKIKEQLSSEEKQFVEFIKDKSVDRSLRFHFECYGSAPTRFEPQRTYDPLSDTKTSSDNKIPLILRNLSVKNPEHWKQLYEKLKDFGTTSGLFTDIKIKHPGGSLGASFQLELKIRKGLGTNLIDVGYGVSQILPLLVRMITKEEYVFSKHQTTLHFQRSQKEHVFLMQQPEVHLHPKAQAAFTSLLAELAQQKNNTFIIETHSDYMVNRVRIDIMKGNIKPEDVSLIYLEAQGKDVEVHNLCFDKQGDFKDDPPDSYDDFFLSESHKLLGWKD